MQCSDVSNQIFERVSSPTPFEHPVIWQHNAHYLFHDGCLWPATKAKWIQTLDR